jgi:RimJ/RimL family protein N-acetyltransferase
MEITYTKLSPLESGLYRAIRLECLRDFPQNFGSTYEEQVALPKLAWEEFIEQHSPDKFTIGAFDGDTIIGICSVNLETRKKTRHVGEIIQMYVKPEYSGRKIGLQLIETTIAEAFGVPHVEQLVLSVVTTNIPANRVYEKAGFVEYGKLKHHFKTGNEYADQRMMVLYRPQS